MEIKLIFGQKSIEHLSKHLLFYKLIGFVNNNFAGYPKN